MIESLLEIKRQNNQELLRPSRLPVDNSQADSSLSPQWIVQLHFDKYLDSVIDGTMCSSGVPHRGGEWVAVVPVGQLMI